MERRTALLIIGFAAAAALAAVVTVPLYAPAGAFHHLDGRPGMLDHVWSGTGAPGAVYLLGDLLCHQDMGRSFSLNGSQLPFCIRDVGILVGFTVGTLACVPLSERLENRRVLHLGLLLATVTFVEWCAEHIAGNMPEARFATALVSGVGIAMVLAWMMYGDVEKG